MYNAFFKNYTMHKPLQNFKLKIYVIQYKTK